MIGLTYKVNDWENMKESKLQRNKIQSKWQKSKTQEEDIKLIREIRWIRTQLMTEE